MSGPNVFSNPYVAKRTVTGSVVAVLRGVTDRRGLYLIDARSRAVARGHVHELMRTDETPTLQTTVNRVALLAFCEIVDAGVLLVGDSVYAGDQLLGHIAGFDETHMPNHQNICLTSAHFTDGEALGLEVGAQLRFVR